MVRIPKGELKRFGWTVALAGLWACGLASAQIRLTPEQVNTRKAPDYTPVYAEQMVIVQGVVSAPAFHFPGYSLLAFQQNRRGIVLDVPETDHEIDSYKPGDEIEAEGV